MGCTLVYDTVSPVTLGTYVQEYYDDIRHVCFTGCWVTEAIAQVIRDVGGHQVSDTWLP